MKILIEKSYSGNRGAVKNAAWCSFNTFISSHGVKETAHISLNDTPSFDQPAAVRPRLQAPYIRFIIERFSVVWLAFSKFPVESSAGQAGMQPVMRPNMCLQR